MLRLWSPVVGLLLICTLLTVFIVGLLPALARQPSTVVFFTNRDGNDEIYLMDFQRGLDHNLTRHPAWDAAPARSPDGRRIAFTSLRDGNQELYLMDADGGNLLRLTNNATRDIFPAWSPDSERIAFSSDRDGNWEIYVMNADGSNPLRLTTDPLEDTRPAWSPDGQSLIFVSYRWRNWAIYRLDVACFDKPATCDSQLTRLTDARVRNLEPAFSPDGQYILSVSDRWVRNFEIFRMDTDGDNLIQLSDNPAWDANPIWTADGCCIIFDSTRDGKDNRELYIMNADGSNVRRLTINPARDSDPS